MSDYVIVWDLETIPDLVSFARAHGLVNKTDDEVKDAMGNGFPKPPYHSIVCIGAVVARRVGGVWKPQAIGAPSVKDRSEKELIGSFVDRIAEFKPRLVTYNGNGFDLPVFRYRAMLHEVSAPGLFARPYFNRYTDDALDLCDALSSFGASAKMKLDEVCKVMGLDGKPNDINGSQVYDYYRAGKVDEITAYCVSDVINTYRLWLRWELFRGALSVQELSESEEAIRVFRHRNESPTKPLE